MMLVPLTQIQCLEEFIISRIDAFISLSPFITCHKFTVENSIHLYTVVSLYNVSHSFEHYTTGVFQKLSRFDVISINHRTDQYTIFECDIDLSPNDSLIICTHIITTKMYKTPLQSSLCTLESRDPGHQRLCISNRQPRTLGTIASFEPFYALVASLQPRETFSQSSDIIGLLQQVAFIIHNFHFFQFVSRHIKETLIRIDVQRIYCSLYLLRIPRLSIFDGVRFV